MEYLIIGICVQLLVILDTYLVASVIKSVEKPYVVHYKYQDRGPLSRPWYTKIYIVYMNSISYEKISAFLCKLHNCNSEEISIIDVHPL